MIIQCEKCRTRFRLDDSKISESGVRVRCSRCTHTFVVKREPAEEKDFDSILQGWGASGGEGGRTRAAQEEVDEPAQPAPSVEEPPQAPDTPASDEVGEAEPDMSGGESFPSEEAETPQVPAVEEESPVVACGFDAGEKIQLPAVEEDAASAASEPAAEEEPAMPEPEPVEKSDHPEPDFTREPVEPRWPVADGRNSGAADEELPPLSIASRRKGPRLLPFVLAIAVLAVAGVGGFFLMKNGGGLVGLLPEKLRGAAGGIGKSGDSAAIRSLEGAFQTNREAGELFVMRGEVVNTSGKPLTSIQVTGTVYGKNGEILAQKTVFCGNVISGEEVSFLPYSSMEKKMGRQFGETLANLEVSPGMSVPFVIVFRDVPKEAADYGARVAGPAGGG